MHAFERVSFEPRLTPSWRQIRVHHILRLALGSSTLVFTCKRAEYSRLDLLFVSYLRVAELVLSLCPL